jgi:pyridoxal phosphate enzyme (YggS family)
MLIIPQNSMLATELPARLRGVRAQIAAAAHMGGRSENSITLVAVSKQQHAGAIRALAQLGVSQFAENYLQEAVPKLAALADLGLTWHYIGRLQANKTRLVAEKFAWVHGLDRLRIAQRLAAQRPAGAPPLNVCIQVQDGDDAGKGGVCAREVGALAAALHSLPQLRLRGLMCILPQGLGADERLGRFTAVQSLYTQLNREGARLDTLSMGMSGDFAEAIRAGATLVRIGTALFGPRDGGAEISSP